MATECSHDCDILTADISPNASHYLDCPIWEYFGITHPKGTL